MLDPRIVSISGRRQTISPTNIIFELILPPVGEVERRICHNKVGFQGLVQIVEKCISVILSEICINTTDSHIHLSHFPCIGIGFLPVNRDIAPVSAVSLNKFRPLYEHTARTAARIIYTAVLKRTQYLNKCTHHA